MYTFLYIDSKGPNQPAHLLILLNSTSVSHLSADTHSLVRSYIVHVNQCLNLYMLDIFHAFVIACWPFIQNKFKKKTKNKKNFKNTTRVPTSLVLDQARCLVGPDLGSNCFKGCLQTTYYRQQRNLSSQGRYIAMKRCKQKVFQLLWTVIAIKRATFLSVFLTCTLYVQLRQFANL